MSVAYLPVEIVGALFLLDARSVREVLGSCSVVRVPHATMRLPGVFAWRGLAIPLIDIATTMGFVRERQEEEPRQRTVIADVGVETVGLAVDEVREVLQVESEELRPVHTLNHPFAVAEVEWSGRVASVVDLEALLASALPAPIRAS